MRPNLLLFILLLIPCAGWAKCGGSGIYVLSSSNHLNKNGWIVLEFYETNQAAIPELNKKRPIYLQSENEKVPLVPVEVLQGEFRVTQVILKPGTSLKVNETYVLHIDSLSQQEGTVDNDRWNSVTNIYEPFEFQIFNKVDSLKPEMKGIPKEMDFRYKKFGCGPAAYVDFKLAGIDHSDFFTRVIVRNKATGKTTDYLVALKNGVVSVGHGMCGGPFRGIGNNCEVRFELDDQSGNASEFTSWIAFKDR